MHKFRIALAAILVALAAVSAVDSASAGIDGFPNGRRLIDDVTDIELQARNHRNGHSVSAAWTASNGGPS
jgi:hypothetical protein